MISKAQLKSAFELVMHNSLHKFQVKNSHYAKVTQLANNSSHSEQAGAIAVFRSKATMQRAQGVVVTSMEALTRMAPTLTHWTPNVFRWLGYDTSRRFVRGHREQNLKQINSFVLDVDFKDMAERDAQQEKVLSAAVIEGQFIPTMVVKTAKGFHLYYVLTDPIFVRQTNNRFPALKMAGVIANNLKRAIQAELPSVDVGCNNFGIFRIPRVENTLYFDANLVVATSALVAWSQDYSKRHPQQANRRVVKLPVRHEAQLKQPWAQALLQKTEIIPGQGMARHNAILTLALAGFQSQNDQEQTYNLLDEFNSRLQVPVSDGEVRQAVRDAYSGRYRGAAKVYIEGLLKRWAPEALATLNQAHGWTKFAKARSERKYSHVTEWAQDVLNYLNAQMANHCQVTVSTRQIQQALGISPSSLNRALKYLVAQHALKAVTASGQPTRYQTLLGLFKHALAHKQQLQNQWRNYLPVGYFSVAEGLISEPDSGILDFLGSAWEVNDTG
ncbi:primase C-terminal domain-containing protein [Secundilactobacillus kimchicus]|uniref:primase C-terminal domain-containing protein n=1 Tax=Secundilactobacillus kimchicus TaxID=528209 RepID=UPI0024A8D6C8|nr:primase C-terminal domain-containing protein [Secundilactobacillus kimchicus]